MTTDAIKWEQTDYIKGGIMGFFFFLPHFYDA